MRNIKVIITYDGTNYHGFQRQAGHLPTIQQSLEETLSSLLKHPVSVNGAGRTDAGVHAMGQVISFQTNTSIPTERIVLALNGFLPTDIAAVHAEEVESTFHAQFSAKGKVYRYHIYNSRNPSVFDRLYSYRVPQALDIQRMNEAASHIIGEHDFSAFKAAASKAKTSVRNVVNLTIENKPPHIFVTVEGNGFLYNMVRIITGTLLYVGKGKLQPDDVKRFIDSGKREEAGPTLPPQGLCLMEVKY